MIDFSDARAEELDDTATDAAEIIRARPPRSVLTLTDVTGVAVNKATGRRIEEYLTGNKPYVRAAAVVGVSGIVSAILATMRLVTGRSISSFANHEEALDWLVRQE